MTKPKITPTKKDPKKTAPETTPEQVLQNERQLALIDLKRVIARLTAIEDQTSGIEPCKLPLGDYVIIASWNYRDGTNRYSMSTGSTSFHAARGLISMAMALSDKALLGLSKAD